MDLEFSLLKFALTLSNIFTVVVLKCPWQAPECSRPAHMDPSSAVTVTQSFELIQADPLSLLLLQALPKRDDDDDKTLAPPLLQENVFIEASRPKYLEDLHSEALEGLKMMQQEGKIHSNEGTITTCQH